MQSPQSQFACTVPAERLHPIVIENVSPVLDGGRYSIKRVVGDTLQVTADVFREGHDHIRVHLQHRKWYEPVWQSEPMISLGNDAWAGSIVFANNCRYEYRIAAWPDQFESWRDEIRKKSDAFVDVSVELQEGLAMLRSLKHRDSSGKIELALHEFERCADNRACVELLLDTDLAIAAEKSLDAEVLQTTSRSFGIIVDRIRARYAAWYELFPRSAGSTPGSSGTFADVISRLDSIAAMGFDVLYFPPIHPIGQINRKGPNNAVTSHPGDPGSPYAIGSEFGGHDAIEASIGTLEDFHRLAEEARAKGMELALDFAIQATPDHPWVNEHPSWFHVRPDGTIKHAENPPKKYEDIYPINFTGDDWQGLWIELRRTILYWIDQGVTIFRVDNPHTKPFGFWEWVIREVQNIHPEAIFLAEAFTRPKVMKALAKVGFTQSYSYFTWRNDKQGLIDYLQELTNTPVSDYMRANLFPTTPDILPFYLQQGGPAAFKIRLTLAATLSSVYGMYSGYELCESAGIPGREEFINSEKYELKVWDWDRPGHIRSFVTLINEIRRDHPALHHYDNLQFHWSASDQIICYSKVLPETRDTVLIVVNLDPFRVHDSMIYVPPERVGVASDLPYVAHDLISGDRYDWSGGDHYVRLDPAIHPAHLIVFESRESVAPV